MINYLLLLQYPLLFLPMLVIGLAIYGSDFDGIAGGLYVLAIVAAPLVTAWRWSALVSMKRLPGISLAVVGLLSAFWLYRNLHFSVWDEHAWFQAALVMVLGFVSSLLSMRGAGNVAVGQGEHGRLLLLSLFFIALVWLSALAFPFLPFLALAVLFIWTVYVGDFSVQPSVKSRPQSYGLASYMLLLAVFLVFLPVWDYRVNSQWALMIAISFAAAAPAALFARRGVPHIKWVLGFVVLVDFLLVLLWPALVITAVQAVVAGTFVGAVLGIILRDSSLALAQVLIPGIVQPWVFGMLFGFLFYSNYAYTQWRLILLLPLLYLIFRDWRKARLSLSSAA